MRSRLHSQLIAPPGESTLSRTPYRSIRISPYLYRVWDVYRGVGRLQGVQGVYRVCIGCVQGVYRVYIGCVQGVYRVCMVCIGCIQGMYGVYRVCIVYVGCRGCVQCSRRDEGKECSDAIRQCGRIVYSNTFHLIVLLYISVLQYVTKAVFYRQLQLQLQLQLQ